jgi:hypothetical protein
VQLRRTCAFHPSLPVRGLGHCRSEETLGIRISVGPWRHCQRMRRCGGNLARTGKDPQQPPAGLPKHAARAGAPGLVAASALPGPDSDSDGRTPARECQGPLSRYPGGLGFAHLGRSGTGASSRAVPKSGVRSDMNTNRTSICPNTMPIQCNRAHASPMCPPHMELPRRNSSVRNSKSNRGRQQHNRHQRTPRASSCVVDCVRMFYEEAILSAVALAFATMPSAAVCASSTLCNTSRRGSVA